MSNQPEQKNPMDRQVGGDHYKHLAIQPTHFWIVNNLPATQGAVVKYLTRHRFAKGREDLEKALHFVEILMHYHFDIDNKVMPATWTYGFNWVVEPTTYTRQNEMPETEATAVILTCTFYCRAHLELVKSLILGLIKSEYPTPGEELESILTKSSEQEGGGFACATYSMALDAAKSRLKECSEYLNELALLNKTLKTPASRLHSVIQYDICQTIELLESLRGGDAGKPIFVEKDAMLAPPAKVFFTLPQALHVAINRLDDCMGWIREALRESELSICDPVNLHRHRLNKISETISLCRSAIKQAEEKAAEQ